ncbi:MAG: hypothetical protein IJY70_03175 [Clostridia bacterium]|nr:hypothetical protein [Clostridia bacterium]
MKNLSTKWQQFIAYFTAFLGIIPFVLAGGAILMKSDDESAKKSAKMALILFVPFAVIDIVLTITTQFLSYNATAGFVINYGPVYLITAIVAIVKAVLFLIVFIIDAFTMIKIDGILAIFGGDKNSKVVSASQHSSNPAYADRVRQVKTYDAPADEAPANEE